jgi:hypothetical protein
MSSLIATMRECEFAEFLQSAPPRALYEELHDLHSDLKEKFENNRCPLSERMHERLFSLDHALGRT